MNKIILFILLFCYVFGFYVLGIAISILIAFPLYAYAFINKAFFQSIIEVIKTKYFKYVFIAWAGILFLSLLYPILFLTFDFSLFKIIATQLIHMVAAIPILAFLSYKSFSYSEVENTFIGIFVCQTIIQLIVITNPILVDLVRVFNQYQADEVTGPGSSIRGMALSAATTYHLSLVYGVAFILYVKSYLVKKVSFISLLIGFFIFIGIFFAGRTGLVGVVLGIIAYMLTFKVRIMNKIKLIIFIPVLAVILLSLVALVSPDFSRMLDNDILPYVFEFYYNLEDGGSAETQSTNQLQQMWDKNFDPVELLIGSGKYTDPLTGGYYMRVDPGILRHLLFMGIIGYVAMVIYQLILFPFWKMDKRTRYFYSFIFLYFCIMEFKGVTLGANKFIFSVSLLLMYSYLYLKRNEKENLIYNSISS